MIRLVRSVEYELGVVYLSFSGILKSYSTMYGGEHIFPFRKTTTDYLSYDRDSKIVRHCFYLIQSAIQFYHKTPDRIIVEGPIDIQRRRYRYLMRLDDTG